jgi:F0F1-type ATP synthase epsilon subunit
MSNHKLIRVIIRDTQKVLFDGEVDRISSFNEVGRFDVYPMHANFISIINQEITLFNNNEKVKEFKIEQAIMKVKQDMVHIFLGIETLFVDENSTIPSEE